MAPLLLYRWRIKIVLGTNETPFYVGVFSYWLIKW